MRYSKQDAWPIAKHIQTGRPPDAGAANADNRANSTVNCSYLCCLRRPCIHKALSYNLPRVCRHKQAAMTLTVSVSSRSKQLIEQGKVGMWVLSFVEAYVCGAA